MPEAILKFKLYEEQEDFIHAKNGMDYWCSIEELRKWITEQDTTLYPDEIIEKLTEILQGKGIII